MRKALTTYAEYKDSGLAWLGRIPSDWSIIRNKEIFKERGSVSNTGKETLLTISHITGVTPRSEKTVNMFMAETMVGYKICHEGDLIINTMWAWMGALGTSNELGICSPSYNVYMPQKGIPYNRIYFDYLFRIPNAAMEMTRNSKGIVLSRLRLYAKDFFQIETILPSLEEQEAIAHYLDTKTTQIDRKIDLLTQKAQRYEELKKSLINETVTGRRRIDNGELTIDNGEGEKNCQLSTVNYPLYKDSGIEWIGEILDHWEVRRLKDLSEIQGGKDSKDVELEEGKYPIYGSGGIFGRASKYLYAKPSVLLGRKGTIDKPLFVTEPFWSVDTMFYTNIKRNVEPKFFYYQCLTIRFGFYLYGSAVPSMSSSVLNRILLPIPNQDEQKEIVEYLDTKTAQIDQIIQTINTQIEKLKELHKTLINDVVTGKIKIIDNGEWTMEN